MPCRKRTGLHWTASGTGTMTTVTEECGHGPDGVKLGLY